MGKKYVIEVEDKPLQDVCGIELWKVKNFNCYISKSELEKLEEYKEPHHEFEVGDVCKIASSDHNLIITKIDPDYVTYMWDDGSHGMIRRSVFEFQALFVRHSEEFCSVLKEVFNATKSK